VFLNTHSEPLMWTERTT